MAKEVQVGLDIILQVNVGSDAAPSWITVGKQVNGDFKVAANTVDTTTKEDSGWSNSEATFSSWSVSFEGKLQRADAGIIFFENAAWTPGSKVHIRWWLKEGATAYFEGKGALESWDYGFPVDDAAGFTGAVKGKGKPTRTSPVPV
jgi:hypothetical protein